ncbi:MAG TPA: isoprenylcysteine carboxylmethyltransferase family protein [Chloroflexi bacterium]|nr:isoprenylcysteine carboxylmethyltransferase family protein [Chloroflexota bacterium]
MDRIPTYYLCGVNHMKPTWFSVLFVFVQFLCLAVIGLTGPLFAYPIVLSLIELIGLFLGIWAVVMMRIGHFNLAPEPLTWSKMTSRGPYRIIRHPMYLALLLTTSPLIISDVSSLRLVIWFILLVNLILKMEYEEDLLQKHFPDYASYRKQTARLIPGVY